MRRSLDGQICVGQGPRYYLSICTPRQINPTGWVEWRLWCWISFRTLLWFIVSFGGAQRETSLTKMYSTLSCGASIYNSRRVTESSIYFCHYPTFILCKKSFTCTGVCGSLRQNSLWRFVLCLVWQIPGAETLAAATKQDSLAARNYFCAAHGQDFHFHFNMNASSLFCMFI